jgi:hypothetical protein
MIQISANAVRVFLRRWWLLALGLVTPTLVLMAQESPTDRRGEPPAFEVDGRVRTSSISTMDDQFLPIYSTNLISRSPLLRVRGETQNTLVGKTTLPTLQMSDVDLLQQQSAQGYGNVAFGGPNTSHNNVPGEFIAQEPLGISKPMRADGPVISALNEVQSRVSDTARLRSPDRAPRLLDTGFLSAELFEGSIHSNSGQSVFTAREPSGFSKPMRADGPAISTSNEVQSRVSDTARLWSPDRAPRLLDTGGVDPESEREILPLPPAEKTLEVSYVHQGADWFYELLEEEAERFVSLMEQTPDDPTVRMESLPPSALTPLPASLVDRAWEAINTVDPPPLVALQSLGTERIAWAPFAIDSSKPRNMFRLSFDAAYGINRPDRAEFIWKKQGGGGPSGEETSLNYQDFSLYNETGSSTASGFFKIPLRLLDPEVNPNTAGLGTIEIGSKILLFEDEDFFGLPTPNIAGDQFRVTSIMRTYMFLGPAPAKRGLQNGHISLEPGLLWAYELSPNTVFHGDARFWIPMGGTQGFSGEIVRCGIGASHVLYSTPVDTVDCQPRALIPSLELTSLHYLRGKETLSGNGTGNLDGSSVFNLTSGLRYFIGEKTDVGVSLMQSLTERRVARNSFTLEFRILY